MNTSKGKIKQTYEVTKPVQGVIKQRFLLQTESEGNLFMTLWDNIHLLNGFKVGDEVELQYNSKSRVYNGATFTDNYVNALRRVNPKVEVKQPQPTKSIQWTHDRFISLNHKHDLIEIDEAIFTEIITDFICDDKELTFKKIDEAVLNPLFKEEKQTMNRYALKSKIGSYLLDLIQVPF